MIGFTQRDIPAREDGYYRRNLLLIGWTMIMRHLYSGVMDKVRYQNI